MLPSLFGELGLLEPTATIAPKAIQGHLVSQTSSHIRQTRPWTTLLSWAPFMAKGSLRTYSLQGGLLCANSGTGEQNSLKYV